MVTKQLSKKLVTRISEEKNEPGWMTEYRLQALAVFEKLPMPSWGPDLSRISSDIAWYVRPAQKVVDSWDQVPRSVKNTFDRLGIDRAEQYMLAGVGFQIDAHVLYQHLQKEWRNSGIIFLSMDEALQQHGALVKKYFGTLIAPHNNKFAALNSALWSGGAFVYVPENVQLEKPLQTYFRIEMKQMGQFERTMVIAEPNSKIHFIEGCSAPVYAASSLHAGVVELFAHARSNVRYTTIQNWSTDVYNLVTKRAIAYAHASVEWLDGNLGSTVTMKYPTTILQEEGARANLISLAMAHEGQHQDTGGRMIHRAGNTSSCMISRSIGRAGGRHTVRNTIQVEPTAQGVQAYSQCNSLLLDTTARVDAYPHINVAHATAQVAHEASMSSLSDEQLFYLASRGISSDQSRALLVLGFADVFVDKIPLEYAVEINRLLEMELA